MEPKLSFPEKITKVADTFYSLATEEEKEKLCTFAMECIEQNKLVENHINYPSRYAIKQAVALSFWGSPKIEDCIIQAVRFTEDKVRYDVLVPLKVEGQPDFHTLIQNVDSVCIVDGLINDPA